MIAAFIIWSLLAVFFVAEGFISRFSKKPAGFWANAKTPEMKDVKGFNNAMSVTWFIFAVLYEAAGLPFLFADQNTPLVFLSIIFLFLLIIGMMITYTKLENKFRK